MRILNHWRINPFLSVIILAPLALFWRWVFKGEVLYWGTLLLQFWPWHYLVKVDLLAGEWPLWNPWLGNGTPLLANLQSAVFYPPNLIYLMMPVAQALTLSIVLHLILAGLFMYAFGRQIGLRPFAATVSAVAYMLSGYIVGRAQFVTMVNAAAWYPLLLLLTDRLATRQSAVQVLWLALALALQLLAGHAQLWFYGLLLIGAYLIFRSWQVADGRINRLPDEPRDTHYVVRAANLRQARKFLRSFVTGHWSFANDREAGQMTNDPFIDNAVVNTLVVALPLYALRITPMLKSLLKLIAAVTLSLLLSAVQILPTAEFLSHSQRSSQLGRSFALAYSFWPWRLVTLLAPDFFGHPAQGNYWGYANYWEDHAYLGMLPFILVWVAIWYYLKDRFWNRPPSVLPSVAKGGEAEKPPLNPSFGRQRGGSWLVLPPLGGVRGGQTPQLNSPLPNPLQLVPFFAMLIPISMVLALGWNTPIYLWVFDNIPGFGLFQAPARLLIWYTVAMAVLAGVGAQYMTSTEANRPNMRRLLAAGVALTAAGFIGDYYLTGRELTFLAAIKIAGAFFILSLVLLLLKPDEDGLNVIGQSLWQWLVVGFITVDLLFFAHPLIPTLPPAIFNRSIAGAEFIKSQPGEYRYFVDDQFAYQTIFNTYFQFSSFGPSNVDNWQGLKETLTPNFGVYAALLSANNDDPLVVANWRQLIRQIEAAPSPLRARVLGLMNVGYLVDAVEADASPIYKTDNVAIQAIPDALPHAYFVSKTSYVDDTAEAIARLTASDFDSHQEVVIMRDEDITPSLLTPQTGSGIVPVTLAAQSSSAVQISVNAPTAGFMVLTDTFYPGWKATVDGQDVEIWQANLAFRAVAVEAGQHDIRFNYQPQSFLAGLWISAATLVITLLAVVGLHRKTCHLQLATLFKSVYRQFFSML